MNKTIIIMLLMIGATTTVYAVAPHWMPDYQRGSCTISLWWGGTTQGVIGHKSNGSEICYIPRQRHGKPSPPAPIVTPTPGPITDPEPVCNTTTVCSNVTNQVCNNVTTTACHNETSCLPPVCEEHQRCVCERHHNNEGNHYGECRHERNGCHTESYDTCEEPVCTTTVLCEDTTRQVCEDVTITTCHEETACQT
jgi:hypothetical protein